MDEPSTPPLFQVTDLASVLLRPILQLNLLPFCPNPEIELINHRVLKMIT